MTISMLGIDIAKNSIRQVASQVPAYVRGWAK